MPSAPSTRQSTSFSGGARTGRTCATCRCRISRPADPRLPRCLWISTSWRPRDHHALREEAPRGLAVLDQPDIAHHLSEKARVDEIAGWRALRRRCIGRSQTNTRSWRGRTASRCCGHRSSGRNTRRIDEGVHVSVSRRAAPPHWGTGHVDELGHVFERRTAGAVISMRSGSSTGS